MSKNFLTVITVFASIAGLADAQPRRASFMGGQSPERGKCTIEVVVDGAAEVEVRGDNANLRNLTGQPPQWRRFECTGPLPPNPVDFRFAGVDGRGRQQLVQDPRNGGTAVVRIEDPQGGSEGYTFDLFWSNNPGGGTSYGDRRGDRPGPGYQAPGRDPEAYYRERNEWFRGQGWRGQLFQRVRQDVEYVQSETFPGGGDQFRLTSTLRELDELQGKLAAGRYDEQELDDVIGALQRVVRDNRLSGRNRELLDDDLNRLRDVRERHEEYFGRGGGGEDAYHREREEWFRGQSWRGQLFRRVREDLEHVQSATYPGGGDQWRLAGARRELDELQSMLASGRYDRRELDDVIGALARVVQDNRMAPHDREVLADDLNRLQDFRARPATFGVR
jgi:hypothetical protein